LIHFVRDGNHTGVPTLDGHLSTVSSIYVHLYGFDTKYCEV
jgi:hypothetical protein